MNPKSYLTFRMRGLPYALDVSCIRELFPMPQIVPVPEAPGDIIGLLNLRGKVIPVMHLGLRLGQSARYCSPRDNVIVIEWQSLRVAVVVNEVCEVSAFAPESIDFDISYGRDRTIQPAFLSGAVKREEELILILNPEGIVRYTDDVTYFASDIVDTTAINPLVQEEMSSETSSLLEAGDFFSLYCPQATLTERATMARRARELEQPLEADRTETQRALAVVGLNGEYFGLHLNAIREFIKVQKIASIPCCSQRVVGNINLRGEVMTLVDIRELLHLSVSQRSAVRQAVIAQVDDIVAGIAVDEVCDILFLSPSDIASLPANAGEDGDSLLEGVARYGESVLSILNLSRVLSADRFTAPALS